MAEEKKAKEQEEATSAVAASEPFSDLREWRPFGVGFPSRLERWLRDLEREWPGRTGLGGWLPALDVHETDGEYAVTVELPGAKKEDVTVEVKDGILTIRGEKKSEREEKKEKRRYVERSYGSFSRTLRLPPDADADRMNAAFKDGVLTIEIPKSEEAKPRTIAIKS